MASGESPARPPTKLRCGRIEVLLGGGGGGCGWAGGCGEVALRVFWTGADLEGRLGDQDGRGPRRLRRRCAVLPSGTVGTRFRGSFDGFARPIPDLPGQQRDDAGRSRGAGGDAAVAAGRIRESFECLPAGSAGAGCGGAGAGAGGGIAGVRGSGDFVHELRDGVDERGNPVGGGDGSGLHARGDLGGGAQRDAEVVRAPDAAGLRGDVVAGGGGWGVGPGKTREVDPARYGGGEPALGEQRDGEIFSRRAGGGDLPGEESDFSLRRGAGCGEGAGAAGRYGDSFRFDLGAQIALSEGSRRALREPAGSVHADAAGKSGGGSAGRDAERGVDRGDGLRGGGGGSAFGRRADPGAGDAGSIRVGNSGGGQRDRDQRWD